MTDAPPLIDSRAGFQAAVRWGLEQAVGQGARRLLVCDEELADWPLDEPPLLDMLTAWARLPQRRLVLLARRYDELPRRQPRFTAWRRDWDHALEAWTPVDDAPRELPTLLASDTGVCVLLADRLRWRGSAAVDARRARGWVESIDAVLQRSERAFAVKTLGL
jgi:hypothetical protein